MGKQYLELRRMVIEFPCTEVCCMDLYKLRDICVFSDL